MILSGYQTGDEIERNDNSVLYAVAPGNHQNGDAVIKFRWIENGPERETILAAVKRQQFAYSAGVPSVAPILAYGQTPAGVYYVTKRYARSLGGLMHAKIAVRSPGLFHLTQSILSGLKVLHSRKEGAHGNLKLANILIQGTGRLRDCSVAMTDLSAQKNIPIANDIYALGLIIVQLVRKRTVAMPDWPVPNSSDWEALDGDGDRWRGFCTFLLDPARAKDPDPLAAVESEFAKFRSKRALGAIGSRLLIGTAILAILGGGGYAVWKFHPTLGSSTSSGETIPSDTGDTAWCGRLARELAANPARRCDDSYAMAEIVGPLRALNLADAEAAALANGRPPATLSLAASCRNLNSALSAWKAKDTIEPAYTLFRKLRWNIPAAEIARLRGPTFSEDIPVLDQIDTIARVGRLYPDIQATWEKILDILERLEKTDSPVLSKLRDYTVDRAGEAPELAALPGKLHQLQERLTKAEALWLYADKIRVKAGGTFNKPIDGPITDGVLTAWETEMKRFQPAGGNAALP